MFRKIKDEIQERVCERRPIQVGGNLIFGPHICRSCRQTDLTEGDWIVCPECAPKCTKQMAPLHEKAEKRARAVLSDQAGSALSQLPQWHRETALSELRHYVNKALHPVIDGYRIGSKSLAILGPSGSGKTTSVTANIRAWAERITATDVDVADDRNYCLEDLFWAKAHNLVRARREHPLGREQDAEAIIEAKAAKVLIIDELGFEPISEIPFEIVDHRSENSRPTVVTSGLKPEQFAERYGDAMFRRLTQQGMGGLVSAFPTKGPR